MEYLGIMWGGYYVVYVKGFDNSGENDVENFIDGVFIWYYISDLYVWKISLEFVL